MPDEKFDAGDGARPREEPLAEMVARLQAARAAMSEAEKEVARAEIRADIEAYDAYVREHGSPAEHMRRYLAALEGSGGAA